MNFPLFLSLLLPEPILLPNPNILYAIRFEKPPSDLDRVERADRVTSNTYFPLICCATLEGLLNLTARVSFSEKWG
jgi:hypothetical protein